MTGLRHEKALLACVLALFVCRAVIVSAIVPPWQGPDEPTHVALAQLLALPDAIVYNSPLLPNGDLTTRVESDVHGQVLESMAAHRWWDAYGQAAPDPLPRSFSPASRFSTGSYGQPLYYGLAALVLRVTAPRDMDATYFRLRALSLVLGVMTLLVGWAGTRVLLGSTAALGATVLAALYPQFVLSAISPNPDALAAFWGALIWWQFARLVVCRRRTMSFSLLIISAVAAVLTKRSAVPLAGITIVSAVWLFLPQAWRFTKRQKLLLGFAVAALAAAAATTAMLFNNAFGWLVANWATVFVTRRPLSAATFPVAAEYLRISVDYAWLMAGWQRFAPQEWWLQIARALTVIGLCGAAVRVVRARGRFQHGMTAAWTFFLVQALAVVVPGFWSLAAPQGRYLFPVLAPMTVLLWGGVVGTGSSRRHSYAALALIGTVALLDATGVTTVLIQAYLPVMLRGS